MIDLEGLSLKDAEKKLLKQKAVGGVILFSRNYESPEQVQSLVDDVRNSAVKPILIAVDQEGGRVQRFRNGFTRLPAASKYLEKTGNLAAAIRLAELGGWLMAAEIRSVGIDFSFAPVLDVDCGISQVIGDRAFSENPEQVSLLANAFRAGMNRAGMAAVGKHFPGHGSIAPDSHIAMPVDERSFEEIETHDIAPFKEMIGKGLEGIMPAHVIYSKVDDQPAGFSEKWVGEILRQKLGFRGAVFSDDLSMEGAACAGSFPERTDKALQAGCDMVLVCNNRDAAEAVLQESRLEANVGSASRLCGMAGGFDISRQTLLQSADWKEAVDTIGELCD